MRTRRAPSCTRPAACAGIPTERGDVDHFSRRALGDKECEAGAHVERRVRLRRFESRPLDQERQDIGHFGKHVDPVGELAIGTHQLSPPVSGDVARVVRDDADRVKRLHQSDVDEATVQNRLAERAPRPQLRRPRRRVLLRDTAGERGAVLVEAARRDEHDHIARFERSAEQRRPPPRQLSENSRGEVDGAVGDKSSERRRLTSTPRRARLVAGETESLDERHVAPGLVEVRPGREVGVDDEGKGADGRAVVHRRRHGVVSDVREAVDPELGLDLARDKRLRAEAFEHEGEILVADVDDRRRFAVTRWVNDRSAPNGILRSRPRRGQRATLSLVQDRVVDARVGVGVVASHRPSSSAIAESTPFT